MPATLPFWLEPVSIFGSFLVTVFSERSRMLTMPFTLAPLRPMLADTPVPRGTDASLATVGTLSEGVTRVVTSPRYLLGYW